MEEAFFFPVRMFVTGDLLERKRGSNASRNRSIKCSSKKTALTLANDARPNSAAC